MNGSVLRGDPTDDALTLLLALGVFVVALLLDRRRSRPDDVGIDP